MEKESGMTKRNEPPVVLVETWVNLLNSPESEEVIRRVQEMIFGVFEDVQELAKFCRKHGIALK